MRALETVRIAGEIRMRETREAEERERAAQLAIYMLSDPTLEVCRVLFINVARQ